MTHRQQSNLVAALCIAIAAFFFINSFSINIDSGYPKVICIAIVVLSIVTIIETITEARKEASSPKQRELTEEEMTTEELAEHMAKEVEESVPWQDLVVVIAVSFISLILWNLISFIFAGALAILALSLYKKRPAVKSILLAICTVIVLQLIFRNIFTIPLPSPSWWPYF